MTASLNTDPLPGPGRGRPLESSHTGEFAISLIEENACPSRPSVAPLSVRPLVVDSNILRNDLLRANRTRTQSALLWAGSGGGARLFCGANVPVEVDEHLPEWEPEPVKLASAQRVWEQHYLPILRVVDVGDNPPLTDAERLRVEELRDKDSDDVPTAILSLALNAPVLSTDRALLEAVYGSKTDHKIYADWLRSVLAGRALGEADDFLEGGLILANTFSQLTIGSVSATAQALQRMPATGKVAAAIAFGLVVVKSQDRIDSRLRVLWQGIVKTAQRIQPVIEDWQRDRSAAATHLSSVTPYPDAGHQPWLEVSAGALSRASMHTLARCAPASARRLAELLPWLPGAQGEAKVRSLLREEPYFHRLTGGRWQLGRPCASVIKIPTNAN